MESFDSVESLRQILVPQAIYKFNQNLSLLIDVAEKLGIRQKWKTFETLWNRKNMYRDYYQALDQRKTLFFRDDIKKVLA